MVGVAWTGSSSDYDDFIARHGITFPNIDDTPGDVFSRFGVAGQPALAIVNPDGSGQVLLGAAGPEMIDSLIADAVG